MNKIFVSRDRIICDSDRVKIDNNVIELLDSDIYLLEYRDIEDIKLDICVDNNIKAVLFESSLMDNKVNISNKYIIKNGELKVNKFYDNESVNEEIEIDLLEEYSKIDYKFSNICKNEESYLININHKNKNTVSNINNKSITIDGAKLNFVINSIVGKEHIGSVLDQNTRIVTLGNSDGKISPNMFIDCDDIEARHGSVIGTFKDEMVFYLMSRGIEYNDCIKLLVKGYLFSNIDSMNEIREKMIEVIDKYWR